MKTKPKNTILQEVKVTEDSELLNYLVNKQIRKSRSAIKSLLSHKQIRVNDLAVSQFNYGLKIGDIVTIHKHDHRRDSKKLKGLTIIYEDKDILIVDKETGLLSVSTGNNLKETAYNIVNNYLASKNANIRAYVLFRLDRETSGLMIFAKSPEVQEDLQKTWFLKPPHRSFLAIVEGKVEASKDTIKSWLTENKNFQVFSNSFDNGGLLAITHYETVKTNNRFSVLSLTMETSRKNQIRVQLQSIGHPIVGDKKYGSKISPLRRIALHANKISFVHPITKEKLEFESTLPKKMQVMADAITSSKAE